MFTAIAESGALISQGLAIWRWNCNWMDRNYVLNRGELLTLKIKERLKSIFQKFYIRMCLFSI
jgi:hypothetical protein